MGLFRKQLELTPEETDLANKIGFDKQVISTVKTEYGGKIEQLEGYNQDTDDEVAKNGISLSVPQEKAIQLLNALRLKLPRYYYAFIVEMNHGIGGKDDKVGIIKTTDQYEIIRMMGTNGANYDISTENIINKLKEWEKHYHFLEITGAGMDWLNAVIPVPSKDINSFAEEVFKLCPTLKGQREDLIEDLQGEGGGIFLWWD